MKKSRFEYEVVEYERIDWDEFNQYSRKPFWTTKEWIDFVINDSKTIPVFFRITMNGKFIGYAPYMIVKKLKGLVRIAGSPFRGWSTCWMGIEVEEIKDKIEIIKDTTDILMKEYGCLYCEVVDRDISIEEAQKSGFRFQTWDSLELRIDRSDEDLWKGFKTDCRNFIRQFERRGAVISEASPNEEFAQELYDELVDVFAKQNMLPTYSLNKIENIFSALKESDNILCLRVRTPDGLPVASSIFFADKNRAYFWAGASYREHQHYRPNEYMIWYAIQYWRSRGIKIFDLVGDRQYKRKFGPYRVEFPLFKIGKYKLVVVMRDIAEKAYFKMKCLKYRKKGK